MQSPTRFALALVVAAAVVVAVCLTLLRFCLPCSPFLSCAGGSTQPPGVGEPCAAEGIFLVSLDGVSTVEVVYDTCCLSPLSFIGHPGVCKVTTDCKTPSRHIPGCVLPAAILHMFTSFTVFNCVIGPPP